MKFPAGEQEEIMTQCEFELFVNNPVESRNSSEKFDKSDKTTKGTSSPDDCSSLSSSSLISVEVSLMSRKRFSR